MREYPAEVSYSYTDRSVSTLAVRRHGGVIINWEAIGATGEWAGAIMVALTLFYLARQIRQQNVNNARDVQESIVEGFNAINSQLATSEELASLFLDGLYRPDKLSDGQLTQFGWIFRQYMIQYLKIYRLYQNEAISEAEWREHGAMGAEYLKTPGGQLFRESHGERFKDVMEAISSMAQDGPPVDYSLGRRTPKSNR